MLIKLKNSDRFKKEFLFYKTEINKISVPEVKEKALDLLGKLKQYCNLIDEGHSSANNGYINPKALRDNITALVEIRKELSKIIDDSKN